MTPRSSNDEQAHVIRRGSVETRKLPVTLVLRDGTEVTATATFDGTDSQGLRVYVVRAPLPLDVYEVRIPRLPARSAVELQRTMR
jgi:hypothetical protein